MFISHFCCSHVPSPVCRDTDYCPLAGCPLWSQVAATSVTTQRQEEGDTPGQEFRMAATVSSCHPVILSSSSSVMCMMAVILSWWQHSHSDGMNTNYVSTSLLLIIRNLMCCLYPVFFHIITVNQLVLLFSTRLTRKHSW